MLSRPWGIELAGMRCIDRASLPRATKASCAALVPGVDDATRAHSPAGSRVSVEDRLDQEPICPSHLSWPHLIRHLTARLRSAAPGALCSAGNANKGVHVGSRYAQPPHVLTVMVYTAITRLALWLHDVHDRDARPIDAGPPAADTRGRSDVRMSSGLGRRRHEAILPYWAR